MHRSLADFLDELGHAGELVRVEAEVDPCLEAAEITARVARSGGPALLFTNLKGCHAPLLTNLLGTEARICRALGVDSLAEAADRAGRLAAASAADGWFQRWRAGSQPTALAQVLPRQVKSAACQQIVRLGSDVDLGQLPLVQSAPGEAGRVVTAGVTVTAEPDSHRPIAGRFDLQLLARDRLAVCWAAHDEPARLLVQCRQRGEKLPVAVMLGGDPAVLLAASARLSPAVDCLALAGLLRDKPLDAVACRTVDLSVAAESDIVIEGYVNPAEPPVEAGPRSAPLGRYTLPCTAPILHVTALTHRANPIYPAMVHLAMPGEASQVDAALTRIVLPLAKSAIPELLDYDLPQLAAARLWAVLSIDKTYAGQARRVASTAWGMPQFMLAKMLIVVDRGVDVREPGQVQRAVAANVHPGRDVFFQAGPPDPLDPAALPGTLGQRMAIDATEKLPQEHAGPWPAAAEMSPAVRQLVSDRWPQYGLGPEPPPRTLATDAPGKNTDI
ncbi:MAG: UbiD family decarboxylase [Thermoguttaceae bacterium]|jgi:4-hydroxy-3-polyprenylbenzoate decarboxylase